MIIDKKKEELKNRIKILLFNDNENINNCMEIFKQYFEQMNEINEYIKKILIIHKEDYKLLYLENIKIIKKLLNKIEEGFLNEFENQDFKTIIDELENNTTNKIEKFISDLKKYLLNIKIFTKSEKKLKIEEELNKENINKEYLLKLKNELNLEKNNNKNLENKINELSDLLNKEIAKYNNLNLELNLSKNNIKKMEKQLEINNREIKDLKLKISNFPFELSEKEKIISIIFISYDQNILSSVVCKNTDKFNIIENILYERYPEYKKNDNKFMVGNRKIFKDKSLEQNNIMDNDIIMLK